MLEEHIFVCNRLKNTDNRAIQEYKKGNMITGAHCYIAVAIQNWKYHHFQFAIAIQEKIVDFNLQQQFRKNKISICKVITHIVNQNWKYHHFQFAIAIHVILVYYN